MRLSEFREIKREYHLEVREIAELEELDDYELHALYDDFLDEVYPECKIGGYNYTTSRAIKLIDPVTYRCGFADWLDSETGETFILCNDKYYQK